MTEPRPQEGSGGPARDKPDKPEKPEKPGKPERLSYAAAGGVVLDGDLVLVLLRPSKGEVRLPKGHIDPGETPEQAALREVGEETGYVDVEIERPLGEQRIAFVRLTGGGRQVHVDRVETYFKMTLRSAATSPRDAAEEKFTPRWMPTGEAASALTFDAEREWLRRAVSS
jgi:8-oxo-dGTP pyrophosphatase MutT (NUDIX family)